VHLKVFGRNAVIYSIGTISLRTSSFLLLPLYTHTLSMEEYGLLATLLMTIQILVPLMGLGTRRSFIRFAAEYEREDRLGSLFGSTILLNLTGGIVITLLSLYFFKPIFRNVLHLDQVTRYVFLTCGVAFTQSLFINIINYYRAKNDGLKFMISSISAALFLIFVTSLLLLVFKMGIIGVLLAQIMTYGILGIFISPFIFYRTGIGCSTRVLGQILIFGFPLIFAMSADLVLDTSAVYFLGYFTNLETVALYSIGYKLAQIAGMVLILPFQLAFEPFVFANLGKPEIKIIISKLLSYLLLTFAFVALGIVFVSRKLLVIIAPPEYAQSYFIIFLLLPGIAFKGIHYVGQSLLHIKNKSYITGMNAVIFTILSFILNYLFIQIWGLYGAILVFNFTLIGSAMVLMTIGMKSFPIPLEKKRLLVIGIMSIFLLSLVFLLKSSQFYIYYSVIPLVTLLVIIFLFFTGFFNNDEKNFIMGFIQRICRPVST